MAIITGGGEESDDVQDNGEKPVPLLERVSPRANKSLLYCDLLQCVI